MTDQLLKSNYIEPFFVGLFEGDGSLHLGRTKGGRLSYVVAKIALKHSSQNQVMLKKIADHFGGGLTIDRHRKNAQIVWTANSQKSIAMIFAVFDTYPLLTSRKICQLEYARKCMTNRDWAIHVATRDHKYDQQQQLVADYKKNFIMPHYFGPWLSGFYEAEGCFRSTHGLSVYISQNDDWYLLNAIKMYFHSHHKLNLHKDKRANSYAYHYRLSMSGKPTLKSIIEHFDKWPLLGYKAVSYDLFCKKFQHPCHEVTSP